MDGAKKRKAIKILGFITETEEATGLDYRRVLAVQILCKRLGLTQELRILAI